MVQGAAVNCLLLKLVAANQGDLYNGKDGCQLTYSFPQNQCPQKKQKNKK